MTAAQHTLLRIFRHVCDLAPVFARRSHIDERLLALALPERFFEKRANLFVEALLRHRIICARIGRSFPRHWTVFCLPFVPSAVQNFHFVVSEQAKRPERVTGPPVRFVAIENASCLWRDASLASQ